MIECTCIRGRKKMKMKNFLLKKQNSNFRNKKKKRKAKHNFKKKLLFINFTDRKKYRV